MYLQYIRTVNTEKVSAAQIARGLKLGEVQVRKDLASVCTAGLPKVGYPVSALRRDVEKALGVNAPGPAVIVGAGKLGSALMEFDGFRDYGVDIIAAFDRRSSASSAPHSHVPVYPMQQLADFCTDRHVQIGILAVPAEAAQYAADQMTEAGLKAILNFAPYPISVPPNVTVQQENIALSLAYLRLATRETSKQEEEEQYGTQRF